MDCDRHKTRYQIHSGTWALLQLVVLTTSSVAILAVYAESTNAVKPIPNLACDIISSVGTAPSSCANVPSRSGKWMGTSLLQAKYTRKKTVVLAKDDDEDGYNDADGDDDDIGAGAVDKSNTADPHQLEAGPVKAALARDLKHVLLQDKAQGQLKRMPQQDKPPQRMPELPKLVETPSFTKEGDSRRGNVEADNSDVGKPTEVAEDIKPLWYERMKLPWQYAGIFSNLADMGLKIKKLHDGGTTTEIVLWFLGALLIIFLVITLVLITYRVVLSPSFRQPQPPQQSPISVHHHVPTQALHRALSPMIPKSTPDISHRSATEVTLCPDLVVPPDNECTLIIPIGPMSLGSFNITDMNGHVVLHVAPCDARGRPLARLAASPNSTVDAGLTQLSLATGQGEFLASCSVARPAGSQGPVEFHINRASGELYAKLTQREIREHQDRYVLKTVGGVCFHFMGSFDYHAVNMTDDVGSYLATTDVCPVDFDKAGSYFRVRVMPLTDVGLVLCSLLCIDHLNSVRG